MQPLEKGKQLVVTLKSNSTHVIYLAVIVLMIVQWLFDPFGISKESSYKKQLKEKELIISEKESEYRKLMQKSKVLRLEILIAKKKLEENKKKIVESEKRQENIERQLEKRVNVINNLDNDSIWGYFSNIELKTSNDN